MLGGVAFEALDNGVKSCANPKLMQRQCDELSAPPAHLAMAIPARECEGVVKVRITSALRFSRLLTVVQPNKFEFVSSN
jgi:hypothetical protein